MSTFDEHAVARFGAGDETASSNVSAQAAETEIRRALRDIHELGSKLADLRGICKPPMYDGRPSAFAEWKFRLRNFAALLNLDLALEWAEKHTLADLDRVQFDPVDAAKDKLLYGLLVQVCTGRALAVIRRATGAHGLQSWMLLLQEFEPRIATRFASVLAGLLTPHWTSSEPWQPQLYEWERQIELYEEGAGEHLTDALKCAIVHRYAPPVIRQYLRLVPEDLASSWRRLRDSIDLFYAKARQFDRQGTLDYPEVDAVVKGNSKGRGKGKGRGKQGGKGWKKGGAKNKGFGKGKGPQQQQSQ